MPNGGDLGYPDEQWRTCIAGRAKDLIVHSGHNIDPLMIDSAMATQADLSLASATGMPDAYAGELLVCYMALWPGASTAEDVLHAHP